MWKSVQDELGRTSHEKDRQLPKEMANGFSLLLSGCPSHTLANAAHNIYTSFMPTSQDLDWHWLENHTLCLTLRPILVPLLGISVSKCIP